MKKKRPVGIQILAPTFESMLKAVDIVEKSNPDIIDINFGYPVKKVVERSWSRNFEGYRFDAKLTYEMVREQTCL